ncbi:peptidase C39 family protein [Pseudomonas huanghezhanensis]|uniref:peptidase C39 family protein n=1 Tax=Pseudomonas huanghezhanensis TaxID=3002903 RepID=UPI0022861386|nr:peptidase C39 family protein [Pseudomonas sp. BSw22131]
MVLALSGCAGSVEPEYKRLPDRVELNSVPFFRGDDYQSAPGALAGMLSAHNVQITPGLVEKPLKLPGGEAALQQSMPHLARQYGFVVYPLDNALQALLAQVSAGYPVMVRVSHGSVWWKEPRYGVLIGFNQRKRTVVLHVGQNRRMLMSFDSFTSAWQEAGSWAILIQGPRQLPAQVDRERWLKAANELAQAGQEQAAGEAVKAVNSTQ